MNVPGADLVAPFVFFFLPPFVVGVTVSWLQRKFGWFV